MLEGADKLKWIQSIGVGYNQFPLEELEKRGIILTNAVGVNSPAVAEHALALMLSISRKLPEARDNQHKKHWRPYISDPAVREFELRGKTIGVVGLGAIGEGVARLSKAFGCTVLGTKGDPSTYPADGAADEVLAASELPRLLAESDFVVLTCPEKEDTIGLIGAAELAAMKPTATLVNCVRPPPPPTPPLCCQRPVWCVQARGPVVVEDELIAALEAGEIASAAIDVVRANPSPPAQLAQLVQASDLLRFWALVQACAALWGRLTRSRWTRRRRCGGWRTSSSRATPAARPRCTRSAWWTFWWRTLGAGSAARTLCTASADRSV